MKQRAAMRRSVQPVDVQGLEEVETKFAAPEQAPAQQEQAEAVAQSAKILVEQASGGPVEATRLGTAVAEELLAKGAKALLDASRG